MSALVAGARLGGARLGRGAALGTLAAAATVVAAALLERRELTAGAADRALAGAAFGLVLPLLGHAAVARASAGRRLSDATLELIRHGADRRASVLGVVGVTAAALAAAGALLGGLAVVAAHGHFDRAALADLATSAWIGMLSGAAYAGWLSLGALFGRRGGGRSLALGLDWVLGTGTSVVALPWPRAHVRNLIGMDPVLGMPQWGATLALGALLCVCVGVCWRAPAP